MELFECHWSEGYYKKFKDILKIQAFSGERTLLSTSVDVLRTNSNDISDWIALVRRVVLEALQIKIRLRLQESISMNGHHPSSTKAPFK